MLWVRGRFWIGEALLIINLFNLISLYFRHSTYPRLIHIPIVSAPLAWTYIAILWDGAAAVNARNLPARIVANIAIWGILGVGGFYVLAFKDYTIGFELAILTLGKSARIVPQNRTNSHKVWHSDNLAQKSLLCNGSLPLSSWLSSSSYRLWLVFQVCLETKTPGLAELWRKTVNVLLYSMTTEHYEMPTLATYSRRHSHHSGSGSVVHHHRHLPNMRNSWSMATIG
jgi:hypothetical protein